MKNKIEKIDFFVFTGTGNTLLVVNAMSGIFRSEGIDVQLHRIEKSTPEDIPGSGTLGLAFPVAAQATFPLVTNFLKSLPKIEGKKVFMVDTLATFSGAIVGPLKKMLEDKGYITLGAKEIIMPNNYTPKQFGPETEELIKHGIKTAEKYALDLIEGQTEWNRIPVISDIFNSFATSQRVWKQVSKVVKSFAIDQNKCTRCGLCKDLCPVNNISLEPFPIYAEKCQQCMRCINFCPNDSISYKGKKYPKINSIKPKDLLNIHNPEVQE